MSYVSHRPSILHRPHRAQASRANEESLEAQYEREQATLRAKQERQQDTHQRLLRSLYPQPEDKAAAWEALVTSNALLASREDRRVRESQQLEPQTGSTGVLPEGARPWNHSMATQHVSPAEEEAARRRFAAEVAAENQRMAREKEITRAMEEQARRQPAVQDTWYSRGDTHRPVEPLFSSARTPSMSGAATPVHRQSGYPWGAAEAQVPRPQTAQPQPKLPERQYPWSWQS